MLRALLLTAALLLSTSARAEIPILMYHKVDPTQATGELNVHPHAFREQVLWLKARGYTAITISQLLDYQAGKLELDPNRTVVITFDDGWRSTLNAIPALEEVGWAATFFVMSGFTDPKHSINYFSHYDLQWLVKKRHDVQSHTVSHFVNVEWTEDNVIKELKQSKAELEELLKRPVDVIAWPFGRFTPTTTEAAKKLGYRAALTTFRGMTTKGSDAFALKRINVDGRCSLDTFKRAVLLGENITCN